jgi:hypothetical protein
VETDLACANDGQGDGAGPIQDDAGGGANVGETTGNQETTGNLIPYTPGETAEWV